MTKEEIVMATIQEELLQEEPSPWKILDLLNNNSLDEDRLIEIMDTWSEPMKDKYHEVNKIIQSTFDFLLEEEENDEAMGL
jgi:hypothetical protein